MTKNERRRPGGGDAALHESLRRDPIKSHQIGKSKPPQGMGQEAVRLAAHGWPVFRVRPHDKRPLAHGWQAEATTDPERVAVLWRAAPTANIGIATGRACSVLDVDGDEGEATLAGLEARHGALPATVAGITGSGGRHLFFAPNARLRNSVGKLGPGLDTRGHGGFVVAPPSIHPNAGRYRWAEGCAPWEMTPAAAPAWLIELLDPPPAAPMLEATLSGAAVHQHRPALSVSTAYVATAVARELEAVALARAGERNTTLNRAAFKLGRFVADGELDAHDIGSALVGAALGAGLPRSEAERTVASGLRAALRRVG